MSVSSTSLFMQTLEGIRVIDSTMVLAGPFCSMILGDLGADVIKVERPVTGDYVRTAGAFAELNFGSYFFQFNRNKRGITLDLRKPEAKRIFMELVKTADVVVENFAPGVAEKLGVGYADVKASNPQIVYCSISGYGKAGPDAQLNRPAYNLVVAGEAGLLSSYDANTLQETPPSKAQLSSIDIVTGIYAATAILAALVARPKLGHGQYIDMRMIDAALSLRDDISAYDTGAMESYIYSGPDRPFKTLDGWVAITCGTNQQLKSLLQVLGLERLLADPDILEYNSNPTKQKYQKFIRLVEEAIARRRSEVLLKELVDSAVPCAKVNSLDDIFNDEVLKKKILKLKHPLSNTEIRVPDISFHFSDTPTKVRCVAPVLGEHNTPILSELGYGIDEIQKMKKEGVI